MLNIHVTVKYDENGIMQIHSYDIDPTVFTLISSQTVAIEFIKDRYPHIPHYASWSAEYVEQEKPKEWRLMSFNFLQDAMTFLKKNNPEPSDVKIVVQDGGYVLIFWKS